VTSSSALTPGNDFEIPSISSKYFGVVIVHTP
jgi:hypothetical protein